MSFPVGSPAKTTKSRILQGAPNSFFAQSTMQPRSGPGWNLQNMETYFSCVRCKKSLIFISQINQRKSSVEIFRLVFLHGLLPLRFRLILFLYCHIKDKKPQDREHLGKKTLVWCVDKALNKSETNVVM